MNRRPAQTGTYRSFRYGLAMVLSLTAGLLSLPLLPRELAYDPWSWLIWGRQLDHLSLTTEGAGSSFKPLTVAVAALLTPAGHLAPVLWLVVMRTAGAAALLLAFHIGRQLVGTAAGLVAAAGVLTSYQLFTYLVLSGMSEPALIALGLATIDASLARRHYRAMVYLGLASLLQVEFSALLVVYGLVFLAWPSSRPWRAVGAIGALLGPIAAAWLLPDLITAGDIFRSAAQAQIPTAGGPLLTRSPGLATVKEVRKILLTPLWTGWIAEVGLGLVFFRRRWVRRQFMIAVAAAISVCGLAILTQLGRTTGTTRFLLPATAAGAIVGACFWFDLAHSGMARAASMVGPSSARRATAAVVVRGATSGVVVIALLLTSLHGLAQRRAQWHRGINDARQAAVLQSHLTQAVDLAGGRQRVLACGAVYTSAYAVPEVAWALDLPTHQVSMGPVTTGGTIFSPSSGPMTPPRGGRFVLVGTVATGGQSWHIWSSCGAPSTP